MDAVMSGCLEERRELRARLVDEHGPSSHRR